MQNDDRLNAAAGIAGEKLHRDGKLAAERLVGGTDQLTASELMNELQASGGTNTKVLSELIGRHGHVVLNVLRRARVQWHDIDIVAKRVWDKVWDISMKPPTEDGAWNSARSRHTNDPFVPMIKRIAKTQAIDYHRRCAVERKHRKVLEETVLIHGPAWRDQLEIQSRSGDKPTGRRNKAANKDRDEERVKDQALGKPRRLAAASRESLPGIVARLPQQEREVLELHAKGLKNSEIAPIVGCSKGEVSRRLTRARRTVLQQVAQATR